MAANPSLENNPGVDRWIEIAADGAVRVRTGKVDIGQRISTAVALVAAAELGVDHRRVTVAPVDTASAPDEGYTSGSNSMEQSGHAVRHAAATARRHLLGLAAQALGVEPETLTVDDGLVHSRATNASVSYAELAGGRRFDIPVDPDAPLLASPGYARLREAIEPGGLRGVVTGCLRFVHDTAAPDTLHARVVRPPNYNARLAGLDEDVESRLGSATLVREGSFLAVAADEEHVAVRAAATLAACARWADETGLDARDIFTQLAGNRRESLPVVDCVPHTGPLAEHAPPPGAARSLEAVYERPYQMHASLGPSAAAARFEDGRLQVWTHTQGVFPLRSALADALGMEAGDLHVVHAPGSGCYGHNGADDAALDAAVVARAIPGRTVLLKWSREDEHGWEPYGPAMRMALAASLDATGRVLAWSHETCSDAHIVRARPGGPQAPYLLATRFLPGGEPPPEARPNMTSNGGIHRNATPPYAFPSQRIVKTLVHDLPLRTSALRTLGAYANVFAAESFMDELARAAQVDPLEFRLRHLEEPRLRAVLEAAAERFGWERRPAGGAGTGCGIAVARYKSAKAYCAVAVELSVDDAARVRLRRAVAAVDAGEVVDRDGLAAQAEGGIVQAASWTLHEAVGFDGRGVTTRDWESYPILRFDEVPDVETVIVDRPGEPFLGAGEASCGPTGAAIANAVEDAIGLRLRRLPFTADAIRSAAAAD